MDESFEYRIGKIESRNQRLFLLGGIQFVLISVLLAVIYQKHDVLRAETLIIVDEKGTERVRIAGTMPNAVIDGKELIRGANAAGVMLYDQDGIERGGYITFSNGNVALTLDSKKQQTALFVAGPDGGSSLRMWDAKTSVEMRSDPDGSRLTATKDGRVILQSPNNIEVGESMCFEYRKLTKTYPVADVLGSCNQRFTHSACEQCFSGLTK